MNICGIVVFGDFLDDFDPVQFVAVNACEKDVWAPCRPLMIVTGMSTESPRKFSPHWIAYTPFFARFNGIVVDERLGIRHRMVHIVPSGALLKNNWYRE